MESPLVLIVDDDDGVRTALRGVLVDLGCAVATAQHGVDALRQIQRQLPHLILLDLEMPVMTGWELYRALRAARVPVRVIFMADGANSEADAIALGADGFLAKPVDLAWAAALVRRLLPRRPSAPQPVSTADDPDVVIFNTNDAMLALIQRHIEAAGLSSITAHALDVGRDPAALIEFVHRHRPRVVVFDISPPYPENWVLLQGMRAVIDLPLVLTTPNKRALEARVGANDAFEITGDAEEMAELVAAIRTSLG